MDNQLDFGAEARFGAIRHGVEETHQVGTDLKKHDENNIPWQGRSWCSRALWVEQRASFHVQQRSNLGLVVRQIRVAFLVRFFEPFRVFVSIFIS